MTVWLRVTYDPNCCSGAVVVDAQRDCMAVRRSGRRLPGVYVPLPRTPMVLYFLAFANVIRFC